jgi:hypothetical protein
MTTDVRLRPRDCIKVAAIGGIHVSDQMLQLARLRARHPGGVPTLEPDAWSAAFAGSKIVAALGWTQEKKDMVMVVEVDRTPDHWGRLGTLVLIKEFILAAELRGIKVQAMILPANVALKTALTQNDCECVIEIWQRKERKT